MRRFVKLYRMLRKRLSRRAAWDEARTITAIRKTILP